jgi:hypothetical protein
MSHRQSPDQTLQDYFTAFKGLSDELNRLMPYAPTPRDFDQQR